jgi:uncharacterized Zn finger protein
LSGEFQDLQQAAAFELTLPAHHGNDQNAALCRAREIVNNGFVREIRVDADTKQIAAAVGSATHAWKQHYTVTCCLSSTTAADPRFINSCNCPQHEQTGVCKHSIALALTQLPSGWLS